MGNMIFIRHTSLIRGMWFLFFASFPLFAVPYLRLGAGEDIFFTIPVGVILLLVVVFLSVITPGSFLGQLCPQSLRCSASYLAIIGFFIVAAGGSIILGQNYATGLREFMKLCYSVTLFGFIFVFFPRDKVFMEKCWTVVFVSSAVLLLFLIYKYFFVFRSTYLGSELAYQTRIHRNQLSTYIVFLLPYVFFYFIASARKITGLILLCVFFLALVYTQSRGAWLAGILGTLFCLRGRDMLRVAATILVVAAISFSLITFFGAERGIGGDVLQRAYSIHAIFCSDDIVLSAGDSARILFVGRAKELFLSSPFFGLGFGNFQHLSEGRVSHNDYMTILSEMGIVGMLIFFFFLADVYRKMFFCFAGPDKREKPWWVFRAGQVSFVIIVVRLIFENMFTTPFFWIMLGMILVSGEMHAREYA
jgi:O-antigen ligase